MGDRYVPVTEAPYLSPKRHREFAINPLLVFREYKLLADSKTDVQQWAMMLIGLLAIILIAVFAIPRILPDKDSPYHIRIETLQAIITILVISVGAYWYFIERKGTAHANVTLSAKGVRLSPTTALVEARVEIENTGHVLLELEQWDVRLLSVIPSQTLPLRAAAFAATSADYYARWPRRIDEVPVYADSQLQWTALRHFRGNAAHEIEPGERDIRTFDLLVSCEIQTAKLTIALRKPWSFLGQGREPEGGQWWRDRMLISLEDLCRGPVGAVRVLGSANGGGADVNGGED